MTGRGHAHVLCATVAGVPRPLGVRRCSRGAERAMVGGGDGGRGRWSAGAMCSAVAAGGVSGPSVLLLTADDWVCELAVPPRHAGDVHGFLVDATGEDDLEYEDVLVSAAAPALALAVYTARTLRAAVAARNELASSLLGRAVFGPAALVCLEGGGAGFEAPGGIGAGFEELRVIAADTLAQGLAARGRAVPECGAEIGCAGAFGDLFVALCAERARASRPRAGGYARCT